MKKKELKRILENLGEVEQTFDLIDEQVDRSLQVSQKTLEKMITL